MILKNSKAASLYTYSLNEYDALFHFQHLQR